MCRALKGGCSDMDDNKIIELLWNRTEDGIEELNKKYGRYIYNLANHILSNEQDSEEVVNDTLFLVWNSIPPKEPENLQAYVLKLARNKAIERYRYNRAHKRDFRKCVPYNEIEAIIADNTFEETQEVIVSDMMNSFMEELTPEKRKVFMLRYWYFASIKEIADECNMSQSKVLSILFRTRKKLEKRVCERGLISYVKHS